MALHNNQRDVETGNLVSNEEDLTAPLLQENDSNAVNEIKLALSKPVLPAQSVNPKETYWNPEDQRRWIGLLFLGTTMVYATRTIMPLVAVMVAEEFGWDKTDMGLVLGCFFWGYPVFQIVGGHISDRIGGDQVLYRAAFVWGTICIMTPYAAYVYRSKTATVYMMALLRFMMGISQGVHFPSLTSLVSSKVNPSEKALVLTISFSAGAAGSVFTGGIGSLMLNEFHWSTLFYTFGALGLAWAVLLRINSNKAQKQMNNDNEQIKIHSNHIGEKEKIVNTSKKASFPAWQLFRKVPFWGLFIAWSCSGYGGLTLLSWLPTFFTEVFPQHKGWVFNVLPWLVQIPSGILSGYLSGKLIDWGYETGLARKIIFTICSFGMVSSLVLVGFTSSFNIALFLMVNAVGWSAFSNGALPVNIQDIAPNQAGAVYGMMNTAGALQGFIGSYIAGYILHLTESWATVFCSTASVLAVGWAVFVSFGTGKPII